MIEYKNIVDKFFQRLAEYYKIEIDYKWKAELTRKVGAEIGIKDANRISQWIKRGIIPDNIVSKIVRLDIQENLKTLCRDCIKTPGFVIESTTRKRPFPLPSEKVVKEYMAEYGQSGKKLILDLLEDEDIKKALTGLLTDVLQNIAAKSEDNETKLKRIEQTISKVCQSPDGIQERRRCSTQLKETMNL